jgi:predicted Fe-Mo cluster-binding NifX family protein
MKRLAKYGIDVSQISEEDYNKAITQLKNEEKKYRISTSLRSKTN